MLKVHSRFDPTILRNVEIDEEMLSDIIKLSDNGVIVTDLNGRILYVNEGFTKMTEYLPIEVIGKKPGELLHGPETDKNTIERISNDLKKLKKVKETILNYSKLGRKYWIQLDIYPYFDDQGVPAYFFAIESDISEVKEKERKATEYSQRIRENIMYAERLQSALFRNSNQREQMFSESFVLDLPKDSVGGDFYIFEKIQNKRVVLLGDCTGHGASGAIMTAASISIIKEFLNTYKTLSPSMIISKSQEKLANMMGDGIHDTFEATLLFINDSNNEIRFATTNQQVYFFGKDQNSVLKKIRREKLITDQVIKFHNGDSIYLSSDGFKDQFGGEHDKKIGSKQLLNLLEETQTINKDDQLNGLKHFFYTWKQETQQTDDVLLIGLKL